MACVDYELINLISRNAVYGMLQDHTLQAGLKGSDGTWLSQGERVVRTSELSGLVQDILRAPGTVGSATAPTLHSDCVLPTAMFGERDALLGRPLAWVRLGSYVLPAYDVINTNCP